jgi:hypothetical protein
MKIRDHKSETLALIDRFETASSTKEEVDFYRLFEVIDLRLLDEQLWDQYGLSDEDEIPQAPDHVIFPKFT